MSTGAGSQGMQFNEPLLWQLGSEGRIGLSVDLPDVRETSLPSELAGDGPDFPDLGEVDVVRHFTRLSQWNFGVDSGMYPLGSCTMKYNPKLNERQAALPGFAGTHPLLPEEMCQGTLRLAFELQNFLAEITGLPAVTLQPAAGAQGELAGMLMIHHWHQAHGRQKSKILIPDTAHGTNPASAALCGYAPVPVPSEDHGMLSLEAVEQRMDDETAGIMITNPNTLGLFEEHICEIAALVHERGGLVYMDGANLNALMGEVSLQQLGVDLMHLNLHKTFSTPHGGGGPGSGPVCCTRELEPFLPVPRIVRQGEQYLFDQDYPQTIGRLHAFYGNFGIQVRAYSYILSLGPLLKKVTQLAVLNANYLKERLKEYLHLPFDQPCMHECVFNDERQKPLKVTTLDIAKRLLDYGFHAPTVYFPLVVNGAIMIEPTETESKETLDQFVEALRSILQEAEQEPQLLTDAPHHTRVSRLDETLAARQPKLSG